MPMSNSRMNSTPLSNNWRQAKQHLSRGRTKLNRLRFLVGHWNPIRTVVQRSWMIKVKTSIEKINEAFMDNFLAIG